MMAFVLRDVRLRYVESMRRTLADTAAFLGAFVAQDLPPDDSWPLRLATLPPKADLLRVFACNRSGAVIFDSSRTGELGKVYAWILPAGVARAGNAPVAKAMEVDGELRVATPVRRGNELIGWVGVGRPLTTVAENVTKARLELVWSLCSIAAVMVAVGWWISNRLTHSIERLT